MYWIPAKNGLFPTEAVTGGKEHVSFQIVARAKHENELIPGKLVTAFEKCYIAYDGKEFEKQEYEVLSGFNAHWKKYKNERIPFNAVAGGYTKDGEILYVGRALFNNSTQLGKVHPSHKCCYISYDGKEIKCEQFEVLVMK